MAKTTSSIRTTPLLLLCLLLLAGCTPAQPPVKNTAYLVSVPVLSMHESCSTEAPYVSQALYGHPVTLIEHYPYGWCLIETQDGYRGYAQFEGLLADDPLWRLSGNLCQVSAVAGRVYPIADTERPALLELPYDARIQTLKPLEASSERWMEVKLNNGTTGWMQRGDLAMPRLKNLDEVIALSHRFLERPYVWGGNSSFGFDCSGFVQTLFKQMGVMLPRDSRPQAASDLVSEVYTDELLPGDLLFFGQTRIVHVGMYLGDGKFIHAGVGNNTPRVNIADLQKTTYKLITARRVKAPAFSATVTAITPEVKERLGHSWNENNPVPLEELRYLTLTHWGYDGCAHSGELILHHTVCDEVSAVFAELFAKGYPIEKMQLISNYGADDVKSCAANNTSAFCSRGITGKPNEWSSHSFGTAIDINPLLNPYLKNETVIPANGKSFLDRTLGCKGMITKEDACYQAFSAQGWHWGGDWLSEKGYVDYQHFYKPQARP